MAKFYGIIGFADQDTAVPGVWENGIVERKYFGELIRNTRKLQTSENLNDNINVANEISILADPYANKNFHAMRYIVFMGTKWKITAVEVRYPRLILTIGDVYNGPEGPASEEDSIP